MPEKIQTAKPLTRTEARVAGGALVVSVAGSDAPKVWRADLGRLSAAAFELKDGGGGAAIVLKTPAGSESVHEFPSRAEAVAGLQAITQALFTVEAAAPPSAHARTPGFWGKFFRTVAYLLIALVSALVLWVFLQARTPGVEQSPPLHAGGKTGVPLPADQMFGK